MPTLIQEVSKHVVESSGSDFRTNTSFGLPGNNGGHAKFCNTDYTVTVRVYDDLSVTCRVAGTFHCPSVLANIYESILKVCPDNWVWKLAGGHLTAPANAITMATATIDASSTVYTWTFDSGFKAIGSLSKFHGSDTGTDGYLYVSGTGTYVVDDPVYPDPERITVPGFLKYLGYFPWSRYQDGQFKSCNRTSGHLGKRNGSIWRDVRNNEKDHSVDQAHYYKSGAWVFCPKTGTGAQ